MPTMPHRSARTVDEPSRRLTLEEWAALPEDEPGELRHSATTLGQTIPTNPITNTPERAVATCGLIAERQPDFLVSLAASSGRAKSNLSRTLQTMARYGLVRLEKGEGRKLKPVVTFEEVELRLALAA